jgi:hypothetical protein
MVMVVMVLVFSFCVAMGILILDTVQVLQQKVALCILAQPHLCPVLPVAAQALLP